MLLKDRQDNDLAFMLKFENVAWYQDGKVKILDRRIYPIRVEYVECKSYKCVAKAIKDMVTQSEGPYTAAAMGMALAVYEANDLYGKDFYNFMEKAAHSLSTARPTTTKQMSRIVNGSLEIIKDSMDKGLNNQEILDKVHEYAYNYINENYRKYTVIGRKMAELIPDNGKILTQCFAGTVVGTMLRECKKMGKKVSLFCAETRPYYQGARLTASIAYDMGFDVTVITDNMPAYTIGKKKIDLFTSASDVITMDGYVINKVGTFQIALACKYYGIPYYCTGTPDLYHESIDSVEIEERSPGLVIESLGTKIVMDGVKGYYPAFDITPPEYCTGIVTDKGIYKPNDVRNYFE